MFVVRLASGVVLLAAAALLFWFGGFPFAIVLCLISCIGYRELLNAMFYKKDENKRAVKCPEIIGYLGIIGYYAAVYFGGKTDYLLLAVVATFLITLFAYVLTFPKFYVQEVAEYLFAFLYAPVMLGFLYLTRQLEYGNILVWLILISSWGSDTLAYVFGRLFGKRKVFPVLSPKKTLAGCVGGVLGVMALGAVYSYFTLYPLLDNLLVVPILAVISGGGAIMSMLGDLAASAIKRNMEIKDYGKLIPGHGGIMDRFDSVIITAPCVYFLSILSLPYLFG